MTREEAIKDLHHLILKLKQADGDDRVYEHYKEAIEALRTEPCEDAISRAEAMNALDALYLDGESAQGFTADANEDCLIGKYKAIEILDELPSVQPTQKWISVSEGLPKGYCLFCDIDGDVYYGHIYDNKWWADGQDDRIKNVIAWMPLPEPYKAESGDEE